jgi:homoserine dehydrogenase
LLNRAVHLDVRVVRVGLLGYGRIGQAIGQVIAAQNDRLAEAGVELRCTGALVRDLQKPRFGPPVRLTNDPSHVPRGGVDVLVEVLGGVEPARTLVANALRAGVPVVTANKTLMAHFGQELRALAERHQTSLTFDAAVLAGVPFLGSLSRRPLISAARRIAGVINGTSHFIVGAIERGASFDAALADAIARGYAEPDSAADTSGRDAAEKLTILLHLAGCRNLVLADLHCTGIEVLEVSDFALAHALGGTIKPVALAVLDSSAPGAWVGPAFVADDHAFARIDGVTNALQLTSHEGRTVLFAGPGAGPEATATTIIDDIVEAVTGGFSNAPLPPARAARRIDAASLRRPPAGAWYVRGQCSAADLRQRLESRGLPALRTAEVGDRAAALVTGYPGGPNCFPQV